MELAANLLRFSQEVRLVEPGVATSRYELSRFKLLVVTSSRTGQRGVGGSRTQLNLHRFIRFIRFICFMFSCRATVSRIGGNLVAGIGGRRRLELEYYNTIQYCHTVQVWQVWRWAELGCEKSSHPNHRIISRSASRRKPLNGNSQARRCGKTCRARAVPCYAVLQDFGISMKDPWWGQQRFLLLRKLRNQRESTL